MRSVAIWGALGLAVTAGIMLPFQAGVNVALARVVGGPSRAAFVSFAVGTIALLVEGEEVEEQRGEATAV